MGIPSYFSQVVRRHRQIITQFKQSSSNHKCEGKTHIDNLYLDSNSIIYDAIHTLNNQDSHDFEERLIKAVCDKIEFYIRKISPTQRVFIAFDGVAPMAKLNQQRTRRYKSWYQAEIKGRCPLQTPTKGNFPLQTPKDAVAPPTKGNFPLQTPNTKGSFPLQPPNTKESSPLHSPNNGASFNTAAITPGTQFMEKLSKAVGAFATAKLKKPLTIVSASNEVGEGEHKIFEYIRANPDYHKDTTTVIYGLDADLIMLSLNHIHLSKQLYLHRETPEFIKNIDSSLDHESDYLFCINKLNNAVEEETGVVGGVTPYVFMCFLLGNDFLPHFPALNIRTHGIATLTDLYSKVIGNNPGRRFISNTDQIQWKNVALFIRELAKMEHPLLLEEYELRDKQDNRFWKITTREEREIAFNNLPMMYRQEEKYICPTVPGWEARYYKSLLDGEMPTAVAANYLEGLEWVFKYYSGDCPDWQWTYRYNYPPLFSDLQRCVPENEIKLLGDCRSAFSAAEQLNYVLFTEQGAPPKIQWAFCRYFWEAHVDFPEN